MKIGHRYAEGICVLIAMVFGLMHMGSTPTSARPAVVQQPTIVQQPAVIAHPAVVAPDVGTALSQSIGTQVVTIRVDKQKGEPRPVMGRATFDRPVLACWLSVLGADIEFAGTKYINRQMSPSIRSPGSSTAKKSRSPASWAPATAAATGTMNTKARSRLQ
jgi:hypothetical protein